MIAIVLKRVAVAALPLFVSGCVSAENGGDVKFGFARVSEETGSTLRKETVWVQNARELEGIRARVRSLVQKKTIGADTAVQVALLNNRGLQAAYANVGISAADAWQESLFINPSVSLGVNQISAARTIDGVVAANLIALVTRERRMEVASIQLAASQMTAVEQTLSVAAQARAAWIEAVSAWERVSYLDRAKITADAAADLASKLGGTGAMTKADQAREQVLYAELTADAATARLDARLAKERLIRVMGVYGQDIDFEVPNALPALPKRAETRTAIEAEALRNRVDLKIGKLDLEALAKSYGLTRATRFVTDLELGAGLEVARTIGEDENGRKTKTDETSSVFQAAFQIPIFDSGEARLRKSEFDYMRAANLLAASAVNARSEARSAYQAYRSSYDIARHYVSSVLPLRKTIEEEGLLTYNGMITSTFELLLDARERVDSNIRSLNAKRDFWQAEAALTTAIYGGESLGAEPASAAAGD